MRPGPLVLAVTAVVLSIAGCGGDAKESGAGAVVAAGPDFGTVGAEVALSTYVAAFCDSVIAVADALGAAQDAIDAADEVARRDGGGEAVLDAYTDGLAEMEREAAHARRVLRKVGYPDMAGGEAAAGRVRELLAVEPLIAEARTKIENLDGSARRVQYSADQILVDLAQKVARQAAALQALQKREGFTTSLQENCY